MSDVPALDLSGGQICVVGLPLKLSDRFKAAAGRANATLNLVFSAVGLTGFLGLVPHEDDAIHEVQAYLDGLDDYANACVIVLPYTTIPRNLKDELEVLREAVPGTVLVPVAGADGWPIATTGKIDSAFYDQLLNALLGNYFPNGIPEEVLPSIYFQDLVDRDPRVIIPDGSLELCDQVAKHRYKFMRSAVDAFETFLSEGSGGRIDDFFENLGLRHAQSGGIVASLKVFREEICIHDGETETHLKQGDKTAKNAAARIYYYLFNIKSTSYLGILYAGPHPDSNVSRRHQITA